MVHVIGVPAATCTMRILTVIYEKGVTDFTMHVVDLRNGEHKQPAYLAKQPFGVIPVLEDGDFRIHESRAICRYIAAKYRDQGVPLVPDVNDVKGLALFEQWASVEFEEWNMPVYNIVAQKVFKKAKGGEPNEAIVDEFAAKFRSKLPAFETILGKQKYMGGDEFSLIDIFYLPYTQKLYDIGDGAILIDEYPNVTAWWERVSTRDSWKKAKTGVL